MKQKFIQPYLIRKCPLMIIMYLFMLISTNSHGQSVLKARLKDTFFNRDCYLAAIILMHPDSSLFRYMRSKKDGIFIFNNLPPGDYTILITHPSYSVYTLKTTIRQGSTVDLGVLNLLPKADTLTTVIVTPRSLPPQIHGDTLEFNTGNVKLRVNATVEELLRRLPGVQVDQYGNITVNGKKIRRLLVDGEDLFSSDPTIVTRNFNAEMIAKAQVLEKKSDQAQFTGIDDGKTTTTLNLVLKEDSKRGYFLKAEAGEGDKGYHNFNGLLGSFKDRRQFAVLGMIANTGATGFMANVGDKGAGLNVESGGGDALGASAGSGVPHLTAGGAHYANHWNGNENHFNGDYSYGNLITNPFSTSIVREVLPDSNYTQRQQNSSINRQSRHTFVSSYDYIPDTVSAWRLSLGGNNTLGNNDYVSAGSSSFNDTLVNSSLRQIHSDVLDQNFAGSLMWKRIGRKNKRRVFSLQADISNQNSSTSGYLYTVNNFYLPVGGLLKSDTTDQRKVFKNDDLYVKGSSNYTQPLWKNVTLGVSYGFAFKSSNLIQSTYARGDGKYAQLVDSLSSLYRNNLLTQQVTCNLQSNGKEFTYNIATDVLYYTYKQTEFLNGTSWNYHYINLAPRVNGRWNISKYKALNFNYTGFTVQPSITQLQPIQNNNDPLHITLGNPQLRPGFSHYFGIGLYAYKPLMITITVNYGFLTNNISTKTITDSLGRQVSQAINVGGSNNSAFYFSANKELPALELTIGMNANVRYNRVVNYVNEDLSKNDSYTTSGGFSFNKSKQDLYSIQLNSNFNYAYSSSSINLSSPIHYWTQEHNGQVSIFLFKTWEINTNINYNWRQKLDSFDKKNAILFWNAYAAKDFFNNQLSLRWQINDILGQNAGINRTINANQTIENTFNIIGRYWLFTATWRFMHKGK